MNIERPRSNQEIPNHAKKVFEGVIFDVYQWEQECFDGSKATFERLKRPDTVIVFGVLPDGKIILAEQEQPGRAPYLGAIAGRSEKGEEILEAAKREFLEETGYEAERFELWDAHQPADKIDWAVFTFIAKGLKKVSDQSLDAGEKISLKLVTLPELVDIAAADGFPEGEVRPKFALAKYNPDKMEELRTLFDPSS